MKRALYLGTLPMQGSQVELNEEESHHLTQVLRLTEGALIELLDGVSSSVKGRLILKGKKKVSIEAIANPTSDPLKVSVPIHLEMGLIKGDAFEWVIEKAVELRVRSFTPILCDHSVVQLDKKGPEVFKVRWQKIADQALKQCGRLDRLIIQDPKRVTELEMNKHRVWFYEKADPKQLLTPSKLLEIHKLSHPNPLFLLVGPEGGYSAQEAQFLSSRDPHFLNTVSLGSIILRAETAAIYAASLVSSSFNV